jgi:hypothetical protein
MAVSNLNQLSFPSEDVCMQTVLDFFNEWKDIVTLSNLCIDSNSNNSHACVSYVHVSGCDARLLKNANTVLRAYMNGLADNGVCDTYRIKVVG